jgi:hypothetical protein
MTLVSQTSKLLAIGERHSSLLHDEIPSEHILTVFYAVRCRSLGGGLAMITGAQAGIPAVGVSGPNALISGRSFDPPVTPEQMNQFTFNIV